MILDTLIINIEICNINIPRDKIKVLMFARIENLNVY